MEERLPKLAKLARTPSGSRFALAAIALGLGIVVAMHVRQCWRNYWVLADGQPANAHVCGFRPKGGVEYAYRVGAVEYMHVDRQPRHTEREVRPGDAITVLVSKSHPEATAWRKPEGVIDGISWVFFIVLTPLLSWLLLSVVKPQHKWAMDFTSRKGTPPPRS